MLKDTMKNSKEKLLWDGIENMVKDSFEREEGDEVPTTKEYDRTTEPEDLAWQEEVMAESLREFNDGDEDSDFAFRAMIDGELEKEN